MRKCHFGKSVSPPPTSKEVLKLRKLGWKQHLVLIYEVLLCHFNLPSEEFSKKRKSSLDFVSPTPIVKKKPIEHLRRQEDERPLEVSFEALSPSPNQSRGGPVNVALLFPSQSSEDTSLNMIEPAADLSLEDGVFTQADTVETEVVYRDAIFLKPVLREWEQYGDMFSTLSEWSPSCQLQVVREEPAGSTGLPKFLLHDSDTCVFASLNAKYRNDTKFLSSGAVIQILAASGNFLRLVIVSIVVIVYIVLQKVLLRTSLFSLDLHLSRLLCLDLWICPCLKIILLL